MWDPTLRYHLLEGSRQNSLWLGWLGSLMILLAFLWTQRKLKLVEDSLRCCLVDDDGGMFFTLSLSVVHNHLLCFADVEMKVVVLVPRCQGSDLLSIGCLTVTSDQADDGHVVSKLDDGVGVVGSHAVVHSPGGCQC